MLRMPYGLRNSQATQQRHMDNVLGGVKNTSTYVDNILTHSPSEDEHLNILGECFKRIREHNLSLRLDKCDFGKKEVEQFGFVVNKNGIRPTDEAVGKIRKYPRPTCVKETKQFLGLANYYREFVPEFSHLAEPIHELLRSGDKREGV